MKGRTNMTPKITIRQVASTCMPTRWGTFQVLGFERVILNGSRHVETALAMVMGDLDRRRAARSHPFAMLHGRGAWIAPLRLQRPVGNRHADDRQRRPRAGDLRASGRSGHRADGRSCKPTLCRTMVSTRSRRTKPWDTRPILAISSCRLPSCKTSGSAACGCSRIIRRSLAP